MNDNDIVKALECCSKGDFRNCQECKYLYAEVEETENCNDVLAKDALGIITRQKAEIERLKHKYDMAVAEREANMKGFLEELNRWNKETQEARAEAIKEFAERLKEKLSDCRLVCDYIYQGYDTEDTLNSIDSLVKEMVGEME